MNVILIKELSYSNKPISGESTHMLQNTFIHFKSISRRSENALWDRGILTWNDYLEHCPQQLRLFDNLHSTSDVQSSFEAFNRGDITFFANRIHRHEYYRLALSFPEKVMFLDIETTGLSIYYDSITIIGWSIGSEYGVFINGSDTSYFFEKLNDAKIIVTCNGTLFDLKFLKKEIKNINIPNIHIDLRFFAKRVGLSGGQKSIEGQIGFKRKKQLEGMQGESAPILWHTYRKGDNNALKQLIEYNHADIEGMKAIFDECVCFTCQKNKIPAKIRPKIFFSKLQSKIKWRSSCAEKCESGVFIPSYVGSTKPLITYSDLNKLVHLDRICIVGIDLVSSEARESGVCLLSGNIAETSRIKTDAEMISLIIAAGANLVSIDSPLSIPKGRTTFWDDDPVREQYGITRECERTLKKRGISSYPCLIPSMQKLTQRGMTLANKLRKLGVAVIESYPGAAQDIMNIPRKQAGLRYLVEGLQDFGIEGEFLQTQVSHDELDAITSAIVGLFFWAGKFEPLGNTEEEYLIIPDLHAHHEQWLQRSVIGLSGEIGAGKTTVAEHLRSLGFKTARFSDILRRILHERGLPILRSELQAIGLEINADNQQRWLGNQVTNLIKSENKAVVDGLRFPEDRATLIENFGPGFIHLHIDCEQKIREQRISIAGEEDIPLSKALHHEVENGVSSLSKLADQWVSNNSSKEDLFQAVEAAIGRKKCQLQ